MNRGWKFCAVVVVMAMPWNCHGIAMVMPWHCHGNAMVMPWQCHGIAVAMPWHRHGNAMAMPWQCHGNAMAMPWHCHHDHDCTELPATIHDCSSHETRLKRATTTTETPGSTTHDHDGAGMKINIPGLAPSVANRARVPAGQLRRPGCRRI